MKFLDEFREPILAGKIAKKIEEICTRPSVIMEVCGGQTHSIMKYGIQELLPSKIELLHGPGCPVCVTPTEKIDLALKIAREPDVIFCSYGDMLRVPSSTHQSLLDVQAQNGQIKIVYSPSEAVEWAQSNPDKEVVFFSVGFETTAPAAAWALLSAQARVLKNFSMLLSHVLVPPALEAVSSSGQSRVQGFLAAGHVCTIMGYEEYERFVEHYKIPVVISGFEAVDILEGIYCLISQLEKGEAKLENSYSRVVESEGNLQAKNYLSRVFQVSNRRWRGMGMIENSGLEIRPEFRAFDADVKFSYLKAGLDSEPPTQCRSGEVLQGLLRPNQCPAFGKGCTPDTPLGAPMVSGEGACAAYFKYHEQD